MKLLIAGSDEVWALEKHYFRYLVQAGVDTKLFPMQSLFYKYYNSSIVNKILYKAGLSAIGTSIGKQLQQTINEWRPDVVWVFKGMELSPGVLKWIQAQGIKLVNYNPDNPFIFSGKGSGNKNITESIGLYDLHFSYDHETAERITKEYGKPCAILPFAFELSDDLYEQCRQQEEVKKVCFLGNPDAQRADFIKEISQTIPVDVYGEKWNNFLSGADITVFPAVYGDAFWKTLYRYRVQLNLMRPHNPGSHNMRSFEVPGAGGIGLFPNTADHRTYFTPGKEVFLYDSVKQCIDRASMLLNLHKDEADVIRMAARKKSIDAKYSYRDRALQAFGDIKLLLQ